MAGSISVDEGDLVDDYQLLLAQLYDVEIWFLQHILQEKQLIHFLCIRTNPGSISASCIVLASSAELPPQLDQWI